MVNEQTQLETSCRRHWHRACEARERHAVLAWEAIDCVPHAVSAWVPTRRGMSPVQLEQPMKGSHPEGADVSALDHMLAGHATIGPDQGLFLEETWRLHPQIYHFMSELFYEGRLRSRAGLEIQVVRSTSRVNGAGLRYLPVQHVGNQSSSPEEAAQVQLLVNEITRAGSSWD